MLFPFLDTHVHLVLKQCISGGLVPLNGIILSAMRALISMLLKILTITEHYIPGSNKWMSLRLENGDMSPYCENVTQAFVRSFSNDLNARHLPPKAKMAAKRHMTEPWRSCQGHPMRCTRDLVANRVPGPCLSFRLFCTLSAPSFRLHAIILGN